MLDGRWVGQPDIGTIEYDIVIEFTDNGDGTVNGKLLGTTLASGEIDKYLRDLRLGDGSAGWTFPNVDGWRFTGQINEAGEIEGSTSSAQGSVPLVFRKS
jgi:hypothetical protein